MKNYFSLLRRFSIASLLFILASTMVHAKEMIIIYAQGYEPFSWKDKDGRIRGIDIDFLDELLNKKMGIPIRHKVYPWARAQLLVRNGESDAFLTIPSPKRRTYTEITKLPLYESNFILCTGATNPHIEELRDIKSLEELKRRNHLRHVMILGGGWHERNLIGVKYLKKVTNSTQILRMLELNREDVYIEQVALIDYQIKLLKLEDKIIKIPNVMEVAKWHLCVGKKSSFVGVIPKLNQLIAEMKKKGDIDRIQRRILKKYR